MSEAPFGGLGVTNITTYIIIITKKAVSDFDLKLLFTFSIFADYSNSTLRFTNFANASPLSMLLAKSARSIN